MKEYLLQHLLSFPSSPLCLLRLCPIFHLLLNKVIKESLRNSPWPIYAISPRSAPRACSWLSGQLTKALLESLKTCIDLLQETRTEFSLLGSCQSSSCKGRFWPQEGQSRDLKMKTWVSMKSLPACMPLGEDEIFRKNLFLWTFSFLEQTKQASPKLEAFMCRMSSLPLPQPLGCAPIRLRGQKRTSS